MARGHAFHGGPRPPENLHLNIHQGNPLCYFLVGPEMSFVYLVLVIKDQSRPSECAVSSRREATENCNASYRPNDGKVAESIAGRCWGSWARTAASHTPAPGPSRGPRARCTFGARKTQQDCHDGLLTCALTHSYVCTHVFKGKHFWNKYHRNKSGLSQTTLNGESTYRERLVSSHFRHLNRKQNAL